MSITVRASVAAPYDTPVTLEITATLGEWQQLGEQLARAYPGWVLTGAIRKAVSELFRSHTAHIEHSNA